MRFLVTFSKAFKVCVFQLEQLFFTHCEAVWYAVTAAAIAVISVRGKNQHAGELPNSNKKLKIVSLQQLRRNTFISYQFFP